MKSGRARIGVDLHTFDGIFQGSRSHLLGLYSALLPKMPEVDFLFFLGDTRRLAAEYPVFARKNASLVRVTEWNAVVRLAVQLPILCRIHRLDLLHMQYRVPLFCAGRCVCTMHDVLFEDLPEFFPRSFRFQSGLSYRWSANSARHVCTVSEYSRQAIARHYLTPLEDITVTTNGVDTGRFFPGAGGREAVTSLGLVPGTYLLTVGRLEPRKNHAGLLHAYARLRGVRPPLVVVGQRDPGFEDVFSVCRNLSLGHDVRFLESVGDETLPAIYRHARLFVYPSFGEGFGMPVLEAMASGVPVIASDATALPEIAGDAARLVDPGSPSSIQFAIEEMLADEPSCREMIERGLRRVRCFSWERAADELASVYSRLLQEDARRSGRAGEIA